MTENIIDRRLKAYTCTSGDDEEQALKEILQEVALYGLSTMGFFNEAIFHGGTALRILHSLPRFSEDLDFLLKSPNTDFHWEPYMEAISDACKKFGVHPEVIDKSQVDNVVKKMFLKDNSIGKLITLSYPHYPEKKLTIKLEIDTNPPEGSKNELKFLEFPLDYTVLTQNLSSSFAGKCHALLCRDYIKGRDWYDFGWYVSQKIVPNFVFLENALQQQGPWAHQSIPVTKDWLVEALQQKIESVDWTKATGDVLRFLDAAGKQSLNLWGIDFFMEKLKKLQVYLV